MAQTLTISIRDEKLPKITTFVDCRKWVQENPAANLCSGCSYREYCTQK